MFPISLRGCQAAANKKQFATLKLPSGKISVIAGFGQPIFMNRQTARPLKSDTDLPG